MKRFVINVAALLSGCESQGPEVHVGRMPASLVAESPSFDNTDIVDAVEYYHPELDHYFLTIDSAEIGALDKGTIAGWARTGHRFGVFKPGATVSGSNPVCRFYGRPEVGLNSHFFTASPDECLEVQEKYSASWILESAEAFRIILPDLLTGACPADTKPIHRLYNGRADANHRYTTDAEIFTQMKKLGYTPEGYGDVNLPVVMCSPISTAGSFAGRKILEPAFVVDPANLFFIDHEARPFDQFSMSVRYQRPSPLVASSSPINFFTDFNAFANTGLGPLAASLQRGPLGGSVDQSVYQMTGTSAGILMRSWDSPHPSQLPVCQPNCAGYQKHTVFDYRWSKPAGIFTSRDASRALVIEAEVQVKQFEQFNMITGGAPKGLVAGALVYVLFLKDPAGKEIQYVIYLYDSNLATYNGQEYIDVEVIGSDTSRQFVSTSMTKKRANRYTTPDSANDGDFGDKTWSGFRLFRTRLSVQNIQNAIDDLNAKGAGLSTDVYSYSIGQIGFNQEVYYENNGDAWVMGSSFRNLTVREQ